MVKFVLEEKVLNAISAYAPQVGCEERQKEQFWREMDEVMQGIPENEDAVIGGDINALVGR